MTKDMTKGKLAPLIISFTIPLVLGNILQLTYNAVDSIIVGRFVSSLALAAIGTSNPLMTLVILMLNGICLGAGILVGLLYGAKDYRADILVYDRSARPIMIVECKAATVPLTQAVLEQAVRYHSALRPRYLLLTNGTVTYCYQVEGQTMSPLDHLPDYREMRGEAHE